MSKPINDGGPAFPCDFNMSTFEHEVKGMTLRDYFAGQALTGLYASGHIDLAMHAQNNSATLRDFSRFCYVIADSMIEARNQKGAA